MTINDNILKIGINRVKVLPIGDGSVTTSSKIMFLSELFNLGYNVVNPDMYNDSILENYDVIIDTLKSMKGADVDYVPLFSGFPNKVPNKEDFLNNRIAGLLWNCIGLWEEGNDISILISNDVTHSRSISEVKVYIPNWLFDLKNYNSEPIFGLQVEELYLRGIHNQEKRASDTHTEWVNLEFVSESEANDRVRIFNDNNLYSKSSIKESLKEDIEYMVNYFGLTHLDSNKVVFKETKSYIMTKLWNDGDFNTLKEYISTPTDILRMFASLTGSDTSLSENIKFPKMNRLQRRFILESLNPFTNLTENLSMYKSLWLEIGRYLHPGEYRSRYTNCFNSFDTLRNGKVYTFNSKVETSLENKDIEKVLNLLVQRPGIFGRKLHELLVKFPSNVDLILDKFAGVSTQIETKNLLVMEKYFNTIDDSVFRTIINKKGKIIVLENDNFEKLNGIQERVVSLIQDSIRTKMSSNEDMSETKVWVDPELKNYTVPLSQRKMSDGLLSIGRGSRIKFEEGKVLRMFTYWKESQFRTDLDLSVIQFDEDMTYKGQVSYTNLSDKGIVHSGDITSAPYGAAEFIDIDLNKVKSDVRYIGIMVYRFTGESFQSLEKSYGGWMIREEVNSNIKSFDIKTVKNKFNMTGNGNYAIPMIVDLLNREVIFVDLYMKGIDNGSNRNEGAITDVSILTRQLVRMNETKPNMLDLINYNLEGSKAIMVETPEEADITYGIDNCDFNVTNVDEILSQMI